jgi:hypothetical protein
MATYFLTPEVKRELDAAPKESEILADAAKRMMREDVYVRAKDGIRAHYLELLAQADPTDAQQITQLQSTIRAIDGLDSELLKFALSAPRSPKRVI